MIIHFLRYKELQKYLFILFCFAIVACSNPQEDIPDKVSVPDDIGKTLENLDIRLWKQEDHEIDMYVAHQHLNVVKTGTGLRYSIYYQGHGTLAFNGLTAVIKYTITLLNGDTVYSSGNDVEEFNIGKDDVESGLHEGIKYLYVGDKALFIIPYRLAYGLTGDSKKIPKGATLIYNLELIDVHSPRK